jgi:hypothetical protein
VKDILSFAEDVRPDIGAQRLGRDEFNAVLKDILKEIRERHKVAEGFRFRSELDENINVAIRASLATNDRAKERETTHTEAADLGLSGSQALNCLLSSERSLVHTRESIRTRTGSQA